MLPETAPPPHLVGAGSSSPGGCCAPVAVAERWECHPAPLAPSQVFSVGITFFFSLLEVAMATVCWEWDGKGPGWGCPCGR